MANAHEADRPGLNADEAVRELFAQLPVPGKDVVWLADQVVAIAQHIGSVELERVRNGEEHTLICRTNTAQQAIAGSGPLRLFRPLLARFAVLGADETGSEPQLYGGRYTIVRSSRIGPVRLEIAFTNTPGSQRISITRVPASVSPRTDSAPDADAENTAPQPSA
jgi:hypothetical protein